MFVYSLFLPGAAVWADLTHWYHSVYEDPYEGLAEFLARMRKSGWQALAARLGLAWFLDEGAQALASNATLFALTCWLVSRRNVRSKVLARLAVPWLAMWEAFAFTGTLSVKAAAATHQNQGTAEVSIHTGRVHPSDMKGLLARCRSRKRLRSC